MDLHARVDAGEFENRVPALSPEEDDPGMVLLQQNYETARQQLHEAEEARKAYRNRKREERRQGNIEALQRFRAALEKEYGVEDHPKRTMLWDKAYEEGHANGLREIIHCYEDFLELVK